MNKSDSKKLIYWGTAGCASRAVSNFITGVYVEDFMFHHNERGWVNIFKGEGSHTHQQGIPAGTDDSYKIICNTRNPYTMCFSTWTDYNNDDSSLTFEKYLKEKRYENFDTNPSMDIGPIFSIICPTTSTDVQPAVLNGVPLYLIPEPSL